MQRDRHLPSVAVSPQQRRDESSVSDGDAEVKFKEHVQL